MHESVTFHMQDSGQYSTKTEDASSLRLKLSIIQLRNSYADLDIVKMTEYSIVSDVSKKGCDLRNAAIGWKKSR